jgi:glycosyltransferase involved in cell wall biosynthesis
MQRVQFAALLACCDQVFVTTGNRLDLVAPYCRALGRPLPEVIRVGANALPAPRGAPSTDDVQRAPRIGVFSTAAVGKRFDVVLDAFARIARQLPSAELVLIGDLGPPDRPAVKEIAQALHRHVARERIRVTGKLSLSEIASEVASLDVYLFPMSTGANTRSGTLPLALGSALPVVAISGAETDGALFRADDNIVFARELSGAAFADAALRVLRDPSLRLRVAAGARRLYAEHLTWQRIADQLLSAS